MAESERKWDGREVEWIKAVCVAFVDVGDFDFVGITRLGCRDKEKVHANLYFTLSMDTTWSTDDQRESGQVGRCEESFSGGWGQATELLYGYWEP
jgi:hypothetical protein